MNLFQLDFFSSSFMFYLGNSSTKKGTFIGILQSFIIVIVSLSYLIYLSWLYGTNQINPKYRSQSFITDDQIDSPLHQNLIAFRYEYDTNKNLNDLQAQKNITYLSMQALFSYQNSTYSSLTKINVTKCQNPSLNGQSCLDFSSLENQYISLKTQNEILSTVILLVYGYNQVNYIKDNIPLNCASQDDINSLLNGDRSGFRIKLYTQQFNITSLQNQVNYRNAYVLNVFRLVSKTQFSAPISYDQQNQQFNFNQNLPYFEVILQLDEIVQQIQISFPTFPEVLALQDMDLEAKQSKFEALIEIENSEIDQSISVPYFKTKSRHSVYYNQLTFYTAKDKLDENRRLNEQNQYKFQLKIASLTSKNCNNEIKSIKRFNLNYKNTKLNQINQNPQSTDNTKISINHSKNQKNEIDFIRESNNKEVQQYYEQKFKVIQNQNILKSVQKAIFMERNFNLREEEFTIDDQNQIDQTMSVRMCQQQQSKKKCILKLYNSSLSMLDFVYNATLELKRISNFEENIYKKKAFLSHYGVGILNGHFSICIQIPNGGSIENYLQNEQNYCNLAQILIDYIDIFFLMKDQGIEYFNLKVSNMFVHENKGILGEIQVLSEVQKVQQKTPDTIDLFTCIIQILLSFTSNYIEHINLLDSDLVSLLNLITSEKDSTSLNYLLEDFCQKLKMLEYQKLVEIKLAVQQKEQKNQIKTFFEVNEQDLLYQQISDKYTQIIKKYFLLIEDAVIIDSYLQDEDSENALNKCLQITEYEEGIQDSNIYYFYGLSFQSEQDQQQMQIKYLLKCLLLNPYHGDCLNKLASLYEEKCMFKEAIQFIELSLELNPQDDSKYFRLGTIFQKQKLYNNSIKAYKSCIKLNNKKYIYLFYLAMVYMLNNNFKFAIFYFKRYLKQYPNDSHAIYNLSKLYFYQKNMTKSLFYLYKMRKLEKYQSECYQLYQNICNYISIDKQFNTT
ncbi:hypothetical protein ABPG72_020239 [Tetrahymena utriculariae]